MERHNDPRRSAASGLPLNRRQLLRGAGLATTGLGAAALVGCGGGGGNKAPATRPATTGAATSAKRGGVGRCPLSTNAWDTFDLARSRFGPVARVAGYTNLGPVQYRNFARAELEGAFTSSWEQPDATTLNLTLRDNLFWHRKPPVNGRQATVDDIVQSIQRNRAGVLLDGTKDPKFYRVGEYAAVESVEAVDARVVRVKFTRPNPFFLETLSGTFARIQAPEAVEAFEAEYATPNAAHVIGTGPYVLESWKVEGDYELERFDRSHVDPWIQHITCIPLATDLSAWQAAFEDRRVDMFTPVKKTVADDLKAKYRGQIYDVTVLSQNPILGTVYGGAPPWNNEMLYGAIFRTMDRRRLMAELYQGQAVLTGNVTPVNQAFAIPEKELITMPGYLEDHAKDLSEARQMWNVAGGPALGPVTVDIPDVFEATFPGVSATILDMLRANLDGSWDVRIEPYTVISDKLTKNAYGNGKNNIWFGWGNGTEKVDPSLQLWNSYNSASPLFPTLGGVKLPSVDDLTNRLLEEFDLARRMELCQEVDRELSRHYGAGIAFLLLQVSNRLYWNYIHVGETPPFPDSHQVASQYWLDQDDPTWAGRPA
ncbi:MAG: ABC transporter substrate-binding protein [Dehalococcoidia bacterium]